MASSHKPESAVLRDALDGLRSLWTEARMIWDELSTRPEK